MKYEVVAKWDGDEIPLRSFTKLSDAIREQQELSVELQQLTTAKIRTFFRKVLAPETTNGL